ncbi:histidine kinase, partial [Streptomyces abikoensis]
AVSPPAAGGRPQQPARGAAAPGDAGRQAPGWSTEQSPAAGQGAPAGPKNGLSGLTRKGKPKKGPVDDWPMSSDGAPRAGQETPRGHEDVEATGGFPVPAPNAPRPGGGPGDTTQFPPVPATDTPRGGRQDGHTGRFAAPADAERAPAAGPGDTSQFAALDPSGRPQSGTGQFALPGAGVPGEAPGSTSGEYDRPAPDALATGGTGQFPQAVAPRDELSGTTGRFAQPVDEDPLTSTTGQFELPAAGPSPLFEELESNWFRGETPAAGVPVQPADSGRPSADRGDGASQGAWDSPNDERWRRAEAVREPAAGGITTSGLPRRVPRANLVEGTAEQQSPSTTGPQVSRAPDDVRGRLTNLRRGIQQGRQAGNGPATGSTNVGPTHQQER